MSHLPIDPISPEQQQKIKKQVYLLIEKQVCSYYKHRHMGNHSSVPVELAQELLESIEYTIDQAGGLIAHPNVDEGLRLGQSIIEGKVKQAKTMLDLVVNTAPNWQTECRWEAVRYLRYYLDYYDHLHLAHKGPDGLFYPILISPPEGILGIDRCIFYLNIMSIENQIMACVPDDVLEPFWDRLPTAVLNQCEYLLINGMGKSLIGTGSDSLVFEADERKQLLTILAGATSETLLTASNRLCQWLNHTDENTQMYIQSVIPVLAMWTGDNAQKLDIERFFL